LVAPFFLPLVGVVVVVVGAGQVLVNGMTEPSEQTCVLVVGAVGQVLVAEMIEPSGQTWVPGVVVEVVVSDATVVPRNSRTACIFGV
jgi:hypothetical protein